MNTKFKAFVVREAESGVFKSAVEERKVDDLPVGDLLIKVSFSSINYKDALSASGNKGVSKNYPHTPGIDAAGIIADSSSTKFKIDDKVVVTGYDLGMNTSGGFAEYIRVPEEWVLKLPSNISLEQSMGIGTAGLTAGMCIKLLEQKNSIIEKEAIVTGASGGVGCLSVYLLSKLGARVTAVTSKNDSHDFLSSIGAKTIINREQMFGQFRHPLSRSRYDIGIDVVGGDVLSGLLTCMKREGTITCCGNVAGADFKTSVFPFILRGNSLIGVDSAERQLSEKEWLWKMFASDWSIDCLDKIYRTVSIDNLESEIEKILKGCQIGRVVVAMQ